MVRVVVISASFGAGHDGAAAELTRRLTAQGCEVRRYDFVDLLHGHAGRLLRGLYRRQLTTAPRTWGWLLALAGTDRSTTTAARLTTVADHATLDAIGTGAALVVSTYPLASQVLGRLRQQGRLAAPAVTYLTDLSVHPLWVADGVDVHLALHDEAAREAKEHGASDVRIVAPAVAPAFAEPLPAATLARVRRRYGLPADLRLALVVAGAWGVGPVVRAAADIAATGMAVPVIACGHNQPLRRRLQHAGYGIALGWVDDMAALMRACDVVVQNAGGLSSLEALTAAVPALTYRCLPGHGRANADALDRTGWIPWVRERADLPGALHRAMSTPPPFTPAPTTPETVLTELAGG